MVQNIRIGIRLLFKTPGFTAVAVLTLALGIGANTAIFSVIKAVLLQEPPFPNSGRLAMLWQQYPGEGIETCPFSPPNFVDLRERNKSFEDLAAYRYAAFNYTGGDAPARISGSYVSASLFRVMGVKPLAGRGFQPGDDKLGADQIIVLGHGLWQRLFAADPKVIGQTINLENEPYTVVGVMPSGFDFPSSADFWVPLTFTPREMQKRRDVNLKVIGRLKPDFTLTSAQAEMDVLAVDLRRAYPRANSGWAVRLVSLHEEIVGGFRPGLMTLLGATAFVLLLACANVANMLLSRSVARRREFAVRAALGASRWRLAAQLLTESALLAVGGAGVGLLLGVWGTEALVRIGPTDLPGIDNVTLDVTVLGFSVASALLVGIVVGLIPVWYATRRQNFAALKDGGSGGRGSAGRSSQRIRQGLMIGEVALSLVLMTGAGLMLQSFWRLQDVDPGFRTEGVLITRVNLPQAVYPTAKDKARFFDRLLPRLGAMPGVSSVSGATTLPLLGAERVHDFHEVGKPSATTARSNSAAWDRVLPDYFKTLGIPILAGRVFSDTDTKDSPLVVVIDRAMADQYWPNGEAIGRSIKISSIQRPFEIIGIVGSTRHRSLSRKEQPRMYVVNAQDPGPSLHLVIRTSQSAKNVGTLVREAVASIDAGQPISTVRSFDTYLSRSRSRPRFMMTLLCSFAALGLMLAGVGIYGVMAYSVAQQTSEIGIRMALGADTRDIMMLMLKRGALLIGAGVVIGVAASIGLTRVLSSMLFSVEPTDLVNLVEVTLVLCAVAFVACYVPARRATKIDPNVALRCD